MIKKIISNIFSFIWRVGVTLLVILLGNYWFFSFQTKDIITDTLPEYHEVALVLGTTPYARGGGENPYFTARMDAAAKLYTEGVVSYVLISGDNHTERYNEPKVMRRLLNERGVPDNVIISDYAGLRTRDSVLRAHTVFGVDNPIIVSQRFHLARALVIAQAEGMTSVGYVAENTASFYWRTRIFVRELFARAIAVYDIVTHRAPEILGKKWIDWH